MVRAGVVRHPADWPHGGYHELAGRRQRYRVVNRNRLLTCLGGGSDPAAFRLWYQGTLAEKLAAADQPREPWWSEALAVGSADWLARTCARLGWRQCRTVSPGDAPSQPANSGFEVAEPPALYYYVEGKP